jgi:hypothetical protein
MGCKKALGCLWVAVKLKYIRVTARNQYTTIYLKYKDFSNEEVMTRNAGCIEKRTPKEGAGRSNRLGDANKNRHLQR